MSKSLIIDWAALDALASVLYPLDRLAECRLVARCYQFPGLMRVAANLVRQSRIRMYDSLTESAKAELPGLFPADGTPLNDCGVERLEVYLFENSSPAKINEGIRHALTDLDTCQLSDGQIGKQFCCSASQVRRIRRELSSHIPQVAKMNRVGVRAGKAFQINVENIGRS